MKVCFVGIGSIAKRHIGNIREIYGSRNTEIRIDACRREGLPVPGIDRVFTLNDGITDDYDAVFITNPTEYHLDALNRFKDKARSFFIEKPVVSVNHLMDAKVFSIKKDTLYYVAAPLRYNPVIKWIKDNVNIKEVISVRSISSSYLPEWRSGTDYRNNYSAHKDMGGGVSTDLIHEWDYLTYIFGWPQKVMCMMGKKSKLEIDSEDYAIYIAEYKDMIVELHLDYFGRNSIREVQIFTDWDTIVGDIVKNRITFLGSGKTIDFHEERNDYQKREIEHFFNMLDGKELNEESFLNAIKVLELSRGVID